MRNKAQRGQGIPSGRRNIRSMYVDYGFEPVGQIRRERYLNNFYASEAMRQEAATLEAAPFEGDQAYKAQILGATDSVLNEIAQKGDYENMTTAVSRAGTEYKVRSAPIAKNLQAYSTYQKNLSDLYKEGKIDHEDYQGTMKLSTHGYNGLQIGEDGKATDYFSDHQVAAVHNPDIPKMIRENLQGLVPDGQVTEQGIVGQEGGQYKISTTNGIKYVDASRVDAVMDMVMKDPRVNSYLERKAEIRTVGMDGKSGAAYLQNDINSLQSSINSIDQRIAQSKNARERNALEAQKATLIQGLGELQGVIDSGDEKSIVQRVRQHERRKADSMYREAAREKYTYEQTQYKKDIDYDGYWMMQQRAAHQAVAGLPNIQFTGTGIEIQSEFGNSDYEVVTKMQDINTRLGEMREEWVANSQGWSDQKKNRFAREMRGMAMEVDYHRSILAQRYGQTNAGLLDTEEYRKLEESAALAVANYQKHIDDGLLGGFQIHGDVAYKLWQQVERSEEAVRTYLKRNATNDPAEGRRSYFPPMATATGLGLGAKAAAGLNEWAEATFMYPPNMQAFEADAQGADGNGDLQNANEILSDGEWTQYGPVNFSRTELPGVGRVAQVSYKKKDSNETKTLYVPLEQTGIDMGALGLVTTSHDMFAQQVERLQLEGIGTHTWRVTDKEGRPGQIKVNYDAVGGVPEVVVIFGDYTSKPMDYNSPEFVAAYHEGGIRI